MKVLDKAKATGALGDYASNVKQEPVIVTSRGKPIAALLPIENADLETVSLSTNPQFIELIERSRARHKAEGAISGDELRSRLGSNTSRSGRGKQRRATGSPE
jgi:prevent-host-death family protein